MTEITQGLPAPDFSLPAAGGTTVALQGLRGKKVVLYFYPKDSTAGCTNEAREFKAAYADFAAADAVVLGVSRDSIKSHEKFADKLEGLPFPLLSDVDETVCNLYGVIKEKNMYGKKVLGIERSTFVIDREGRIVQAYRKVKAAGHAAVVLAAVQQLG